MRFSTNSLNNFWVNIPLVLPFYGKTEYTLYIYTAKNALYIYIYNGIETAKVSFIASIEDDI